MLKAGIDGGNNTVIIALEEMEPLIIPTILVPYKDYDQGLDMLEDYKKPLKDCMDVEIILNHKDSSSRKELGRFYVGEYAKEMERINVKERDIGRTKKGDDGLEICILSSLAVAVAEKQNAESGSMHQKIKIVTGLPCLQFRSDKAEYAKQFRGSHKLIFRGSYDLEVELEVLEAVVEMEGASALKRLIFNDSGEYLYKEEELIDRLILGIEIGEFTSEVIALSFRENDDGKVMPEYKQKLCMGIDLGIANAKQPVIDYLRDRYSTIVDRYDIDASLKRRLRRGCIDLENGEMFNIMQLYEENLSQLASSISTLINNKVKSAGEKGKVKHTLLYGGGVCVLDYKMGNFLRERIQELVGGKSSIVENPHTVNALSYLFNAVKSFGSSATPKANTEAESAISYSEQKRMIQDPKSESKIKEASMPIQIIVQDDGIIWEAKTIRGAVASVLGDDYLAASDIVAEKNMRIKAAEKEVEKAKKRGIKAIVYDGLNGNIYGDKVSNENKNSEQDGIIRVRVENDRLFLLSLVKLGTIKIMERKDTYFLRSHQKWSLLYNSKGALQCCSNCLHRIYNKHIVCPVYNTQKEQNDGTDCGSYTIYPGSYTDEYTGGDYIDICKENSVDELIEKVGQLWMIQGELLEATE